MSFKYKLPKDVTLHPEQELPNRYTKETKLKFIDSKYGEFVSYIKSMEDAARRVGSKEPLSTHPEAVKQRRKATNLAKYGSTAPAGSKAVQVKYKATVQAKYGVDNISQLDDIKEKKKKTVISNYGVTNPMHSEEVKDRLKKTNIRKYGKANPAQNKEVQETIRVGLAE